MTPAYMTKQQRVRHDPAKTTKRLSLAKGSLVAYCTSHECNRSPLGLIIDIERKYGKIKDVSQHETFCPDCGNALFWERL